MPSLEQLQAQLASLTNRQQNQGGASAALNAAAFNFASSIPNAGGINLSQLQNSDSPATAALNAVSSNSNMPATAAMNAGVSNNINSNLFESATNLKALLGADQSNDNQQNSNAAGNRPGQNILNRLPSSNGMFPGSVSNASLGNLFASSNRLSSLLSLNSFLSREPSLADLAMMPNGAQFAALGVGQQNPQGMANRFNQGTA